MKSIQIVELAPLDMLLFLLKYLVNSKKNIMLLMVLELLRCKEISPVRSPN